MTNPILSVRDLHLGFPFSQKKRWLFRSSMVLHAVNGVSFDLHKGQTLGIVGESGCGKSSLIRAICGLGFFQMMSGEIILDGEILDHSIRSHRLRACRSMQMIFQDPISSLNPRHTVREILMEGASAFFPDESKQSRTSAVMKMIDRVGVAQSQLDRFPHEFSGGQCQRIGIARALLARPRILLCDEPVSALDVSIQAQVLNLLKELQAELGLTMIFVSHDLAVVGHVSDDIMVIYLGGIMEHARTESLYQHARHPYTKALLSSAPVPDPKVKVTPDVLPGDLPSPIALPAGCFFASRCPHVTDVCKIERPRLEGELQFRIACHHPL